MILHILPLQLLVLDFYFFRFHKKYYSNSNYCYLGNFGYNKYFIDKEHVINILNKCVDEFLLRKNDNKKVIYKKEYL